MRSSWHRGILICKVQHDPVSLTCQYNDESIGPWEFTLVPLMFSKPTPIWFLSLVFGKWSQPLVWKQFKYVYLWQRNKSWNHYFQSDDVSSTWALSVWRLHAHAVWMLEFVSILQTHAVKVNYRPWIQGQEQWLCLGLCVSPVMVFHCLSQHACEDKRLKAFYW